MLKEKVNTAVSLLNLMLEMRTQHKSLSIS